MYRFLIFFLLAPVLLSAQDLNLTQFYLAPAYNNPAFTGTTPHYRLIFHNRTQWYNLTPAPQRQFASFEYNFVTFDGGLGVSVQRRNLGGSARWQTIEARVAYAQRIYINPRWVVGAGLELVYANGSMSQGNLIFEDQLLSGSPTQEALPTGRASYIDVNAGLTIYNKRFYGGIAVANLLKPKIEAYGTTLNQLERSFLVQSGYKLDVGYGHALSPALFFKYQKLFYQLDLGANWEYEDFFAGLWYRGVPFFSGGVENAINQDALALTLGARVSEYVTMAFSHDFSTAQYSDLGGSFELSLIISPRYDRRGRIGTHDILCPIGLKN